MTEHNLLLVVLKRFHGLKTLYTSLVSTNTKPIIVFKNHKNVRSISFMCNVRNMRPQGIDAQLPHVNLTINTTHTKDRKT